MEPVLREGTPFLDVKRQSSDRDFPQVFADALRSHGETYFWPKGGFHVVTRAADARQVLTSPDFSADRSGFFISRMPDMDLSLIKDFFGIVQKMMVMSDAYEHTRRRQAAGAGLEDQVLDAFARTVEGTVKRLVGSAAGKDRVEFMSEVAVKLPSTVLADLFSIPESDRSDFFRRSNIMTGFFGGASSYQNKDGIEVNEAAIGLRDYFKVLIADRRVRPGHDYVSILLRAMPATGLTEDELVSQLVMMLVAGQVTTTDQIGNIMFQLATRPELRSQLRSDVGLIPAALEEGKRFDPAVTFIFRVARVDTRIGAQPVRAGEVVFIGNHAVNRDLPPEQRPEEFDIRRPAAHFAYGHGSHYCLGAKLGRLQMRLLFEEIFRSWPDFTLESSERDHYSLSFSGFQRLELAWA